MGEKREIVTWKPFRFPQKTGEGFITVTDNSGWQSIVQIYGLAKALEAKRDTSTALGDIPIFGFGKGYDGEETLYTWAKNQGMNLT